MTALIYALSDHQVLLASDTLRRSTDRKPLNYLTKILLLPHLRGVICARGSGNLLLRWYLTLQEDAVIPDLAWMADRAQDYLPKLTRDLRLPDDMSTTIYHFGWDEKTNRFIGHSFARKDNFTARDLIRNHLVLLPGYESVKKRASEFEKVDTEALAELMRLQRAADEGVMDSDQAGIGGEVHVVKLEPDNIVQFAAYRFEDYGELFERMVARVQS